MKPMKVSAVKATEYYYQADPLYSLDGDHKWIGAGAKSLGLTGNIDYEKFTNLLNGMAPDGSKRLAGREADHGKYAAIDMPISIPKSFSILAMADPEFRQKLTETLISSAGNVEDYVYGRQTANGVTEQVKGGMIGAAFVHSTSRAGDPNFHCHTVVANIVQRPDGTFSTLENREIFVNQSEHQQRVYSDLAAMAHKMGYATELATNKGGLVVPEISGIGKDINDQFSKRHEEIRNADGLRAGIKERMPGLSDIEVDGLVQLHTKAAKDKDLSGDELNKSFQTQLKGLGTSSDEILSSAKLAGSERVQSDLSARDFVKMAAGDLAEQESVTSEKNILAMATKLSTGVCVRGDLQGAFRESVKSGDVIDLGKGGFTTPEIQKIEHHIATVAVDQAHAFKPLLDKTGALDAITAFEAAKGFSTTAGQAAAIEYTLTGEGRLMVIQGDAGAGKSTAFDAINRALEGRDDVTVRGLGFQGKAAAGLESSSGIKSGTIDGFLLSKSDWDGQSRQLWVVDEASMASSKHLGALMTRAENENAQIVLVGDAKQIASIGAGKLFQDLQEHGLVNTAIMDEVRRQKTDYTIDVATELKQHNVKAALEILDNKGNIHECTEKGGRINLAAEKYVAAGDNSLAITVTNRERIDLIQEIRTLEKASGKIGAEDHIFKTREPINLMGVEKRFASSYAAGNSIFINQNIEGLKRGGEAQILGTDTARNTITVQNQNGDAITINTLQNGDKISQFREAETAFSVGEKIIWTKNDNTTEGKASGLKNGVTGEILGIENGVATIKTEHGGVVEQKLDGAYITNGQAITIDKSQGVTARHVITVLSSDAPPQLLSENKAYVALTRETHDVEVITDDKQKLLGAIDQQQEKTSTLDHADELLAGLKARQAADQSINDMPAGWKENQVADEKTAVVIEDKMQEKQNEQQQQRAQIQMSM